MMYRKSWVRSSKPYPIELSLKKIKGLLNETEGMDIDCFNLGVRNLANDEVQGLKKTGNRASKSKNYMDMRFSVSII